MTFRVRIDPVAQQLIDEFAVYMRSYGAEFAIEQIDRLERIISVNLGETPLTWPYFAFTGAPYRAYLFRVGRRTQYWIPSTSRTEPSIFFIFGTPCATPTRSKFDFSEGLPTHWASPHPYSRRGCACRHPSRRLYAVKDGVEGSSG